MIFPQNKDYHRCGRSIDAFARSPPINFAWLFRLQRMLKIANGKNVKEKNEHKIFIENVNLE
jgi:hypothetical protein